MFCVVRFLQTCFCALDVDITDLNLVISGQSRAQSWKLLADVKFFSADVKKTFDVKTILDVEHFSTSKKVLTSAKKFLT